MTPRHRGGQTFRKQNSKRGHKMGPAAGCFAIGLVCILGVSRSHALGWAPTPDSATGPGGSTHADSVVFSCRFLDLDDPCAILDAHGAPMLTLGRFDANDMLIRAEGFDSIDAWCAYAETDPDLAGGKTEQTGWRLSGGKEDIFWQLRAIVYLCPEYQNILAAIESRPLIYNGDTSTWVAPGIELTAGVNYLDQYAATVYWNPDTSSAFGGVRRWDRFPPLVALAHELVHAYQRIAEDRPAYISALQIPAMKNENLVRYAFYRKVPGYADIRPRPGNRGFYRDSALQYLFDDVTWPDWSLNYAPWLDIFEDR